MKIFYKPFGLLAGFLAARVGQSVFKALWARIDDADPPAATAPDASIGKVVGAAALEAATRAGVAAAVDRTTARAFHHLIGVWPGENADKQA